ncbi:DEAD/DEAH box helicase [Cellvibrio sp. KY-YJ-3]|uniref:DEAD/DEAH box helicase n=1 Tax=Cellvibrio sp. KY-YJ-3 TaxID=454662 RepID=UPI001243E61E|nr:DEAD/DEAH box helicase family protein [Cellvibrio sp. KY-YJ-3]QEY11894.1 DEAD/DEAH box helicase [Cellvibrio sp. KY-YJ-3]
MQLRRWQSECITKALNKFSVPGNHFLCLATPGAGKTVMASVLASKLLEQNLIDLVLCFSPSVIVSSDFERTLAVQTNARMDGLLGSKGRSLTYQAMLFLDDAFWKLFDSNRIFVIFDEIHHCAGDGLDNANAWGQKIIRYIQGRATYSLALTGTPWRSDQIPIALSNYCQQHKIHCDYVYGLTQAVADNVCRTPKITLIDNDKVWIKHNNEVFKFSCFGELLKKSKCSYQQLIENETLISYFIDKASKKLSSIRKQHSNAGGLIVAASVEHANKISEILHRRTGDQAYIATYREEDPLSIINTFKYNSEKWIISIGMISEGTNIPRLRVCCHLTRVKTELHFRQVLGRILRSSNDANEDGFLYMPAEPNLLEYANRVAQEIPDGVAIKFDSMSKAQGREGDALILKSDDNLATNVILTVDCSSTYDSEPELDLSHQAGLTSLARSYESTVNIFGRFKQELLSLPLTAC